MKKKTRKPAKKPSAQPATKPSAQPVKESTVLSLPKWDMPTVIVLTIAAATFALVLFSIHSEDFLHGAGEIFDVYGDEVVEFETATVNEVTNEEIKADEVMSDVPVGTQELAVTVTSGRYKGEQLVAYNYFGVLSGVPVKAHDSVTLTIKTHSDGALSATVYELYRIPVLLALLLLFVAVVAVVGHITGIKSLVGLLFTGICLFTILIPLIIKGAPAMPTTFIVCSYVAFVCFVILGGVRRKSMVAFLGTVAGMGIRGFWYGNALSGLVPFFVGSIYLISGSWKESASKVHIMNYPENGEEQ